LCKSSKTNDYEECISFLEQILSVYANQLDTYQRFGENVDECNLDVGTTLHNMGIVHLLNGNFDDSIQLFKRALEIRDCNDSIDNPDRNVSHLLYLFPLTHHIPIKI
jgi:tetratricopeptide (TPR) repeat protein